MVSSYFKTRKIVPENKDELEVGAGVPQGSVLGPTLWNIHYDDVLSLELTRDAETIAFAEDLALICATKSEQELIERVNENLGRITHG